MGKHYDFISKIPKTIEGQKAWIINKVKERLFIASICTDALSDFKLCNNVEELYDVVNTIIDDTIYYLIDCK